MDKRSTIPKTVALSLFGVLCLYPLVYLIFYSLKTNDEIFLTNPFGLPLQPQFGNYARAVMSFNILDYFKSSIIVTVLSIIGVFVLTLPFAYATTRMRWKLRGAAVTYLAFGLFIPIQVGIIPLSILVRDLHLANTYLSLIVPYVAFNLSFASLIIGSSLRTVPYEMEESAFIDGASVYRTFWSIVMPLTKAALATTLIFTFLNVWNEYTVASVLVFNNKLKTLPIGLSSFVGEHSTDWGAMGACLVLASVPTIIVYLVFSEQVERALTVSGAIKG